MIQPLPLPARRPVGFVIGGVLLALSVVLMVVCAVTLVRDVGEVVDDYRRVPATGGTVHLDGDGTHLLFVEFPDANDSDYAPPPPRVLTGEGTEIPVRRSGHSETYSSGGRDGRLVGKVDIPRPGTYRIVGYGEPGATDDVRWAIGERSPFGTALLAGVGIFVSITIGIGAVIILVVSAIRRSRQRRLLLGGAPTGSPALPNWTNTPPTPVASHPGARSPVMLDSRLPPPPANPPRPPPPAPSAAADGPKPPPLPGPDDPRRYPS